MDVLKEFLEFCGELGTSIVPHLPGEAVGQSEKVELLCDHFAFCCFVELLHKDVA